MIALSKQERDDLKYTFAPLKYAADIGLNAYQWQEDVENSDSPYIAINGCRRGGKSFFISFKPCHKARFFPGSITLITAPTEAQAFEDMRFVRSFMAKDRNYPEIVRASDKQIELDNGSRIIVLTATEVSARGYPNPHLLIADEAGFIRNVIFEDCLLPMLNGNPDCRMLIISSPHGRSGDPGKFFYDTMQDKNFERFEVRAPFDIDPEDPTNLIPAIPEKEYKAAKIKDGIRAYYSPRHTNLREQRFILSRQGALKYAQNQLAVFVEPEDQVFSYDEIERAFGHSIAPLSSGIGEAPKAFEFQPIDFDAVRV